MAKTLTAIIMVLETRMGFGANSRSLLEIDDGDLILTGKYTPVGGTVHGGSELRTMLRFQPQLRNILSRVFPVTDVLRLMVIALGSEIGTDGRQRTFAG